MALNEIPFGGEIRSQPLNENFQYLDQKLVENFNNLNQKSDDIQQELNTHKAEDATLAQKGHVQLSNEIDSDDETKAATPKAVKNALDWVKENGLGTLPRLNDNQFNSDESVTSYPLGKAVMRVSSNDTYPYHYGILETHRFYGDLGYQWFYGSGAYAGRVYFRSTRQGIWSDWVELTGGGTVLVEEATSTKLNEVYFGNNEDSDETKNLEERMTQLEAENAMLKVQNKALADRTDFHEEVLTEIILAIYS